MVPDYYAMLEVDPTADRSAIEAALSRKQPFWSSGTRNPKTKHTYQSYLDQIPAIRQALLGDPASRAAYDAERAAGLRAIRDQKLDALQKLIRLRAAKGGLTVADRRLLRDEAVKLGLTAADLDRLAEPIPPKPEAPAAAVADTLEPIPDVLDAVMRRQIRVALDHLGKFDLYDALGVTRDAPPQEIALRADAERQRWMKKTQVTAEKTAWLEVVTLAQSHLNTPTARARYDRTLAFEAEETFAASATFALQGLKELDPGTRQALEEEGDALGLAPDRADHILARTCRTLGIGANAGPGAASRTGAAAPPRLLRCRSCPGVTDHARVAQINGPALCRHCGASLRWSCPVCQRVHWVDEPRCGACGFRLALREPFVRHFEAAQRAFRTRDYTAALAHLKRAQDFAPNHVGARKGMERTRERLVEIEGARAAWEVAWAERKILAARAAVEAWGQLVNPTTPDWQAAWAETRRALSQALTLASRGRVRAATDPRAARQYYRQSLAVATDLPEALAGLERCPPDPPTELSCDFVDGRVTLQWSPPPSDGLGPVTFVIRRKAETAFQHPGEGVVIGQTDTPTFVDSGVTAGTSVAYAVLTRRGEVTSVGAVALGPIFLMGDVRDIRVETRAREVELSWIPPRGAVEVRVVRKRGGPPTGPLDGDRIEADLDHARDTGLETERTYFYGLYAIYRDVQGRAGASRGVVVSAQPHTPVATPNDLRVTPEPDGRLRIDWTEPPRGLIKLLRTIEPFPHPQGARLSPSQVEALAGDWVEISAPDHAIDNPDGHGRFHYTLLVSWAGTLTVGRSASFSPVTDPTDLRAWRVGDGRVNLRWRWGPVGDDTLVALRAGTPPSGPDDPQAILYRVSEADYLRDGLFAIPLPPGTSGPWHIALFACATTEQGNVTSPGTEPTSRSVVVGPSQDVTVAYTFRKRRLTGRRWTITFRTEPPGAEIPPTVLVTHPRAVPLDPDDGEIVARFPAARDGARVDAPAGINLGRIHARIFADPQVSPDALTPFRLQHPEAAATRV